MLPPAHRRPRAPRPARGRAGPLALLALLTACSQGAGCGPRADAPARIRLTAIPSALETSAVPPAVPVLREEFDAVPPDWRTGTDRENPMVLDPDALRVGLARDEGVGFLTLGGKRGAFYRVVPVEPETPYLFEGVLRGRDLAPEVEGARFWLGELSARGSPEELFGPARNPLVRARPLAPAAGREGWQEQRLAFRTEAATRALLVMCQLWVPDRRKGEPDLEAGEADFDRLSLARIDERELWELEAARGVAAAHRGDELPAGNDARARRRVDAMLGAEQRPALLCLPGERLRFELTLPEPDPVLEAAIAPWPAAFRPRPAPGELWVRVNGRELWRGAPAGGATLAEIDWREIELELASFAGKRVTLELGVDGKQPALFGAPVVRARGRASEGWNVLLVSIDTLRSDRVGTYGAKSGATPRLDQLARQGVVFERATANAPYTLPAHATLFSGQFPSVHAVEDEGRPLAPLRSPVLARYLAERGWRTQAFTAAGFLVPDFGFHAGFDGFSIRDPLRHPGSRFFHDFAANHPEQGPAPAEGGTARVRSWIRAHAREPFFLFVHTYEVHDYDPPPELVTCAQEGCRSKLGDFNALVLRMSNPAPFPGSPVDRAHLGHLYDAALRHVDGELGQLFDELERSGIAARTLVVVTSDHGEEMFERGFLQHGKSLHREVIDIPLIVRAPGRAPARIQAPAMQVDVAPTILAALGLALDARMQGRDLFGSNGSPRPIWSEVDDARARQTSLTDGGWKLVHAPTDAPVNFPGAREWSLYDLARDPEERADLSESEGERLERLRRMLQNFQEELDAAGARLGPPPSSELEESTMELLRKLGYGD